MTGWLVGWLVVRLVCWVAERFVDRLFGSDDDCLLCGLAGFLVCWLIVLMVSWFVVWGLVRCMMGVAIGWWVRVFVC